MNDYLGKEEEKKIYLSGIGNGFRSGLALCRWVYSSNLHASVTDTWEFDGLTSSSSLSIVFLLFCGNPTERRFPNQSA